MPIDLADLLNPAEGFNKITGIISILTSDANVGAPKLHAVAVEPPLKDYAQNAVNSVN